MQTYGYTGGDPDTARITAVFRDRFHFVCREGEGSAVLKGSRFFGGDGAVVPTVGDFVRIEYHADSESRIMETLPRISFFRRSNLLGHAAGYAKTIKEQAVAANFDVVCVVSSLNGDLNLSRIQRYMTIALQSGAQPVIVLTKRDLCADTEAQVERVRAVSPDVPVITLSSKTGEGMDELHAYAKPGKTLAFLGMSGVGKSSLLNVLAGDTLMKVNTTRDVDSSKGRHTTTHRQLFLLPSGVIIIDTPGMREMGLLYADGSLERAFPEIDNLLGTCRFPNCRHKTEPGCAIREALSSGTLSEAVWQKYLSLQKESFTSRRKAPAAGRPKTSRSVGGRAELDE